MKTIRMILAVILSLPLAALVIVFDVIKLPIVFGLFVPIIGFVSMIQMLTGRYERGDFLGFIKAVSFVGISLYLDIVFDIDWPD